MLDSSLHEYAIVLQTVILLVDNSLELLSTEMGNRATCNDPATCDG